jgi:hypothetical protein
MSAADQPLLRPAGGEFDSDRKRHQVHELASALCCPEFVTRSAVKICEPRKTRHQAGRRYTIRRPALQQKHIPGRHAMEQAPGPSGTPDAYRGFSFNAAELMQ